RCGTDIVLSLAVARGIATRAPVEVEGKGLAGAAVEAEANPGDAPKARCVSEHREVLKGVRACVAVAGVIRGNAVSAKVNPKVAAQAAVGVDAVSADGVARSRPRGVF